MQAEEAEKAQEDEGEAEGDDSIPMDDRGAGAAVAAEEEDDGDVTEAENHLLDTPPPPNSESMAPDSMDPTCLESQPQPVQDQQI